MAKFRKKPVVIEAVQFNPKNHDEYMNFVPEDKLLRIDTEGRGDWKLFIKTLEGNMLVSKHDWIIKGVNGEFYPCKPDIFEKTYEREPETN